jgi:hypothetical protein
MDGMSFGIEVVGFQLLPVDEHNHQIVVSRRRTILRRGILRKTSTDENVLS